jgi:hypothetical protein
VASNKIDKRLYTYLILLGNRILGQLSRATSYETETAIAA